MTTVDKITCLLDNSHKFHVQHVSQTLFNRPMLVRAWLQVYSISADIIELL